MPRHYLLFLPRRAARLALLAAAIGGLLPLVAAPSHAQAAVRYGYGDSRPDMFTDPRWLNLPLRNVRRLVQWDTPGDPIKTAQLDAWMQGAEATRSKVLLAIDHSWTEGRLRARPSVPQYEALIAWLRARYPTWNRLTPWNEANHNAQPTYRNPGLAWRYLQAARRACGDCKITSPSIIVSRTISQRSRQWLGKFQRYAKGRIRTWTIHNYGDMNRGDRTALEQVERQVKGRIWITEAAGWVQFLRDDKYPYDLERSARGIRNVFRLMGRDPRIDYIYFYQWRGSPTRNTRWDTGVLNADGTERPGYYALVDGLTGQ